MITTFTSSAFGEDLHKLISANFDTSGAFVILSAKDDVETPILEKVKVYTLENPRRIYFDINSSILTFPKREWSFKSGNIKEFKISQFSNDPAIVRVVIYPSDDYNLDDMNIVRLKNNIIIKLKNPQLQNNYFQNTYRDEHTSAGDFYEYATVMSNEGELQGIAGQIQNAYNQATENIIKKDLKLNSKYYLNSVTVKGGGLLINGFGSTTIERPLILTNPSRLVFDIPNTVVNPSIRNKEFQINQTDKARVGQFSVNKARITITSENVRDYIPIFSTDGQAIILANYSKIDSSTLTDEVSDAIAYSIDKENKYTDSLILSFSKPVVHGIDRVTNKFDIFLYNVMKYNEEEFKKIIANSSFSDTQVTLMPKIGLKMSLPIDSGAVLSSYTSVDGKNIKISIKRSAQTQSKTPTDEAVRQGQQTVKPSEAIKKPDVLTPYQKPTKIVVLDAGHGGKDVGAIGGGKYYEKDITLDITKRVQAILEKKGFNVVMTRFDDTYLSLQERVDVAEDANSDIFVSIHVNSSTNPAVTGLETHYYHQESIDLAQSVHSAMVSSINAPNRGLFKSKFYVINHTTMPAILVETGFISNSAECSELNTVKRKQATAEAIANGIIEYLK